MRAATLAKGALAGRLKDSAADRAAHTLPAARIRGVLRPAAVAGAAMGAVRGLTKGADRKVTPSLSPVEHTGVLRSGAAAGAALVAVSAASAATSAIRRRSESQ